MNKKIIIISIILLVFLIGTIFFFSRDRRVKDEEENYTYICKAEFQNSKKETIQIYRLKVNSDNQIVKFYTERKYFYHNDSDYWNALYTAGLMDVNYEGNEDDFTITIKSSDEALIDENGNILTPNYQEYMKNLIDENYQCAFEKK